MSTIALGVPYKDSISIFNSKIVLETVEKRFPDWAAQCGAMIRYRPPNGRHDSSVAPPG